MGPSAWILSALALYIMVGVPIECFLSVLLGMCNFSGCCFVGFEVWICFRVNNQDGRVH